MPITDEETTVDSNLRSDSTISSEEKEKEEGTSKNYTPVHVVTDILRQRPFQIV